MIERIVDLPEGVLGLRASGKLTKEDYADVVEPLFEEARRKGEKIRFLFHFAPDFESFTPRAVWEDMKVGMRHLRLFERCAVVSDRGWIRHPTRAIGAVLPMQVRVFENAHLEDAIAWLRSPLEGPPLTHHLLPERGVLVLEPREKLRSLDFDAVAATVDPWIEREGKLQGIVVHAPEFPGWESVGSFLEHVRFVRDHHKKVERVAIAADGKFAELGPGLAKHFVKAEIRHFGYGEFERALAWASGEESD